MLKICNNTMEINIYMKIMFAAPFPVENLREIGKNVEKIETCRDFFLFPLINEYYKAGHEIVIVTGSRKLLRDEQYIQERLKIFIVKICSHGRISAVLNFTNDIRRIQKYILREKCDLYHANWCYEYAQACLNVSKNRTLVTVHDWPDTVCPQFGNFYWKKRNILGNRVIQNTKYFSAVSPYIEKYISKRNSNAVTRVIPNFYESDMPFGEAHIKDNKRQQINIIAINNGFGKRKNVTVGMKAFEKLHEIRTESQLFLYGDDFEKNGIAYQWAVGNVNISGMHFLGKVARTQIIASLQEADILLHTSIEESFGLIYLEAMANNTVVVAGKETGATPWVLNYGKAGILADVTDEMDVFEKLKYAVDNEDIRIELCKEAHNWLKQEFTLESVKEKYYSYYELIEGKANENDTI